MGRVESNDVVLAYAIESALGTPGADWFQMEYNTIGTFGSTIQTVARTPVSTRRTRRKGSITDLDSAVDFETDLTLSAFRDFIEGFMFARGINRDVTQIIIASVQGSSGDTYTKSGANWTATQRARFIDGALVWASGFGNSANNGLKEIKTTAGDAATLAIETDLEPESAAPAKARISFAGWREAAGVSWTYAAATKRATAGKSGLGTQLQALGLVAGQFVHIGSIGTVGGAVQNALTKTNADDMFGYARVASISADAVAFDKLSPPLQQSSTANTAGALDIVFGEFIRNVPRSSASYLRRSIQFEAVYPGLADDGVGTEYEYALGNFCNTMGFNLPLTDKATMSLAYIGTDTAAPTGTRKPGAATAVAPTQTSAMNTTADIGRLRVTETDEDGLSTDFKSLTLNLNNNINAEKVLRRLGARYVNAGDFELGIEAQLIFTDGAVISAIRNNQTVSLDFVIHNDDGIIVGDVPAMTLGGGNRDYPRNESVLINLTAQDFEDDRLGYSFGVSIIPVPVPTDD